MRFAGILDPSNFSKLLDRFDFQSALESAGYAGRVILWPVKLALT